MGRSDGVNWQAPIEQEEKRYFTEGSSEPTCEPGTLRPRQGLRDRREWASRGDSRGDRGNPRGRKKVAFLPLERGAEGDPPGRTLCPQAAHRGCFGI
jgi:hypothetical protein